MTQLASRANVPRNQQAASTYYYCDSSTAALNLRLQRLAMPFRSTAAAEGCGRCGGRFGRCGVSTAYCNGILIFGNWVKLVHFIPFELSVDAHFDTC